MCGVYTDMQILHQMFLRNLSTCRLGCLSAAGGEGAGDAGTTPHKPRNDHRIPGQNLTVWALDVLYRTLPAAVLGPG